MEVLVIYVIYSAVAVGLTVWLAQTLYRNGEVFLADVFPDRIVLAAALNRLLVTGFYMLNLGYAFLLLQEPSASGAAQAFQVLVNKLGILLVTLGLIHFVNMIVFWRIRRRTQLDSAPPPVPPQVVVRAAGPEPAAS